jgi:tetratricopeptide (TPR) repeat protein
VRRAKILTTAIAVSTLFLPAAYAAEDPATAAAPESPEHKKAVELNGKGTEAMKAKNYAEAVKDFREALDLSGHFDEAKKNLVAALDAYGVSLSKEPKKAIRQYHCALSIDKTDAAAKSGINQSIKAMGLNPRSADHRVNLADQAQMDNDREGVGIEMDAADFLRSHPNQEVDYDSAKPKK